MELVGTWASLNERAIAPRQNRMGSWDAGYISTFFSLLLPLFRLGSKQILFVKGILQYASGGQVLTLGNNRVEVMGQSIGRSYVNY